MLRSHGGILADKAPILPVIVTPPPFCHVGTNTIGIFYAPCPMPHAPSEVSFSFLNASLYNPSDRLKLSNC
ncbi:hypothetical protein [Merismopedia glauca]|uniref:hypothetical protein n=1 Tax=Merismopedia glauca TaxID=292586 RepID=UPI0015E6926C|nr:hypothetical protein [Merismopedia glauca]